MRIRIERRTAAPARQELTEIVTPRGNVATITAAENLFAALALAEPFALEIAATRQARWFSARAGGPTTRDHLRQQLGVAYPQAELRPVPIDEHPSLDPARRGDDERVAACVLALRGPQYLPLRTFEDDEVDPTRAAQADPVLGILGALGALPDGWRALGQLVLRPAREDWCAPYLRLAVEHPLAAERVARGADTSLGSVFALAALLVAGLLAYQAARWYAAGDWLDLGMLGGGVAAGLPALLWLRHQIASRPIYDMRLVQEKLRRVAFRAELRLAVFAPSDAPQGDVQRVLGRVAAAYRQYNLAAGNGLVQRPLRAERCDLRSLDLLAPARATSVLTTRELAGLWHLPQERADLPLLERTTARRYLPPPFAVARGCRIGVSAHQGREVPVHLPDALLGRHLLLVAKTRRGKSSLLLRLARYLMEQSACTAEKRALLLVDPHRDLAEAALGLVPPARRGDVVWLDLSERDRPFGLNLIDAGLGWERDQAVANTLSVFRREFDRFWGPRMEDAFRFALLTLLEVNRAICAADPDGRGRQHTILQVPTVLADAAFRRGLLGLVRDPVVTAWWSGYFDQLDRRLQVEVINPVQTKVHRFAGSRAARAVVGQSRSTIDPTDWLRTGKIVLVNTAKGAIGEDTAALVGGTLLNLVALAVGAQAALPARERRPITLLVDEFHTLPGADYEAILAELSKYGANLVLATQSLARLEALDREQLRALRATVFANLDGLFAFHTSAEDARYLVRELGPEVDEQDLVALGDYQCYARLSEGGERLPAFSVRLDPPPPSDPALAAPLAATSAARYGRERAAVERDLAAALARIELTHRPPVAEPPAGQAGGGVPRDAAIGTTSGGQGKRRNQNRPRRESRAAPHQGTLFDATTLPSTSGAASLPDRGERVGEVADEAPA